MSTLLLRFAAPMQAWGDESKFDIRGTRKEPTKSGIIGLLAAALGYSRNDPRIGELSGKIRIGVRVDQPGKVIRDFQTARAPKYSSDGSIKYTENREAVMEASPYVTYRDYLCDAVFLVGIECDDEAYLKTISEALNSPVFSLYFGRRSCPVTLPLVIGLRSMDLCAVMKEESWHAAKWYQEQHSCIRARIVLETEPGKKAWHTQMDQPVSFDPTHRLYSLRGLDREQYVLLGVVDHDPFAEL